LNRYKLYITAGVALASLIAAPAINSFGPAQKSFLAEGSPLPPVPPGTVSPTSTLLAEGSPLPPVPPGIASFALIAEGSPLPPVPPGITANAVTVAEGSPLPPVPHGSERRASTDCGRLAAAAGSGYNSQRSAFLVAHRVRFLAKKRRKRTLRTGRAPKHPSYGLVFTLLGRVSHISIYHLGTYCPVIKMLYFRPWH
jgi:hypothetical protein